MIKQIKYNRQVNNLINLFNSLQREKYQDSDYYFMGKNQLPLIHINGHDVNINTYFEKYKVTFGLSSLELAKIIIKCLCIENCVVSIDSDTYSVTDYKFELY